MDDAVLPLALFGAVLLIAGLVLGCKPDLAWSMTAAGHQMQGVKSERTSAWERTNLAVSVMIALFGVGMIVAAVWISVAQANEEARLELFDAIDVRCSADTLTLTHEGSEPLWIEVGNAHAYPLDLVVGDPEWKGRPVPVGQQAKGVVAATLSPTSVALERGQSKDVTVRLTEGQACKSDLMQGMHIGGPGSMNDQANCAGLEFHYVVRSSKAGPPQLDVRRRCDFPTASP
ncbi:MAG: hypothetical protein K0V04_17255 [Deltaproteobacteria bacterium]|nr:hypothetical protein [Deltaproteobacteria bacterium]